MKSYNWGIIGPGNIAHDFVGDLRLVNTPQRITAVLSDRQTSAVDFANEFDIPQWFTDLDDFIDHGNVDIAYVATPHPLHYEAIRACLEKRIAVLCEKPIVINSEQHEILLKLSREKNTFLMEGMWLRFLPSFQKLMELLDQKKIGEIISVKAAMYFKAPCDENSRYYDPSKGGGSLLDLGVYCIFLSSLLMGMPRSVKAVGRLSDKNIDEACGILLSFPGDRYAMLESSLLIKQNGPAEIYGTKGILRLSDPWFEKAPAIEIWPDDGQRQEIPLSWEGNGFQFEIEEVIDCVSKQKIESPLMPGILSNNVLKIMDEIRTQLGVSYDQYE